MAEVGRIEALATLQRLRGELLALVEQMTLDQLEHHGLGGGDWSVKELLGHLESWEEHVLGALEAWSHQQTAPI
ncbi:MAG: DinB family protein, partial [Dehalococcoidia bacterium]